MLQRLTLFVVLALIVGNSLRAQKRVIDSLQRLAVGATSPLLRVDALNELAYQQFDRDDSTAMVHAKQAFELASTNGYSRGLKRAATLLGVGYSSQGERLRALQYFQLSARTKAPQSESLQVYNHVAWGITFLELAKFDSAHAVFQAARAAARAPADLQAIYKNMAALCLLQWKNELALVYLDSAQRLYAAGDDYMAIEVKNYFARAYYQLAQMDSARAAIIAICSGSDASQMYYHQIECALNLARVEMAQGRFREALDVALVALSKSTRYNQAQYVDILILIGEAYMEMSELALTGKYLFEALRISEAGHLKQKTALIYNNLAWLNKIDGKLEAALAYTDKAEDLFRTMGDRHGLSESHNVRGLTYLLQKKYPEARVEFDRALEIRRELNDSRGISATLFNISEWLIEVKRPQEALPFLREVAELETFIGHQPYLSMTLGLMSRILVQEGKFEAARTLLEQADAIQKKSNSLFIARDNAAHWVAYYEARGDYKKALAYQQQYQSINEQIFTQENAKELAEYEALYKVSSHQREIRGLNEKQQLQQLQLQQAHSKLTIRNLVIVAVAIVLVLLVLLIYRIRANVRNQEQAHANLVRLNQEVSLRNRDIEKNLASIETLQADLAAKEAKYRGLVEHASDIILEVNPLGHFTYINPAVTRITGYLKQELMETHYMQLIHPEYARNVKAFLHHKLRIKEEFVYLEYPILSRAGASVWIGQSTHFFYENQRLKNMVVVARDISRQKQMEEELIASRRTYEQLVEDIPIGIYRTKTSAAGDFRFLYVSPRWCELNELTAETVYQDPNRALQLVHPEDVTSYKQAEARSQGKLHFEWEGRLIIGTQIRYFRIESRGHLLGDGSIIRQGYQKDITQRKLAEHGIEQAKNEAEQASIVKTEFLANMTHEMLTPLNGIIGFSDLLLKSGLSSVQSKYQYAVARSAQSLLDMVYDVLEFSKMERGELDLRTENVPLRSLFTDVIELARPLAEVKMIALHVLFEGELPETLNCDEWRLRQVMINLLSNALKFTEQGEVQLLIRGNADLLHVAVKDTGVGIRPDLQNRIFEAFVQGDFTTTKRFGGAGLGLTIAQRLLVMMGSELHFSSTPGVGSEFYFELNTPRQG